MLNSVGLWGIKLWKRWVWLINQTKVLDQMVVTKLSDQLVRCIYLVTTSRCLFHTSQLDQTTVSNPSTILQKHQIRRKLSVKSLKYWFSLFLWIINIKNFLEIIEFQLITKSYQIDSNTIIFFFQVNTLKLFLIEVPIFFGFFNWNNIP